MVNIHTRSPATITKSNTELLFDAPATINDPFSATGFGITFSLDAGEFLTWLRRLAAALLLSHSFFHRYSMTYNVFSSSARLGRLELMTLPSHSLISCSTQSFFSSSECSSNDFFLLRQCKNVLNLIPLDTFLCRTRGGARYVAGFQ